MTLQSARHTKQSECEWVIEEGWTSHSTHTWSHQRRQLFRDDQLHS